MNQFLKILACFVITFSVASSSLIQKSPSRAISGRIIGGRPANAAEFPFAAALYYKTSDGQFFCGGSLINDHWILTGGHCVDGSTQFTIHLGTTKLNDDNSLVLSSVSYVIHPLFDVNTYDNDVGLIMLRAAVEFSDYIQPIQLPNEEAADGSAVVAIGWGSTSDSSSSLSNELNYVHVTTLSQDDCKKIYGNQITDNMICVEGNYNEGACRGDIGSPIVSTHSAITGQTVHLGISIFISGNGCEATDPSGYMRTYPYLDWIKTIAGIK